MTHPDSFAPDSARAARSRYRHNESSAARWRLLADAAAIAAEPGQRAAALASILAKALAFLSLEDGLLMVLQDDALQVCASQGLVPPAGARLAYTAAMQAALQPGPQAPLVRQDLVSPLRIGREQRVGLEVLVPLALDGKHRGVLALLSARAAPQPNADDLTTLQALGTLLAALLSGPSQNAQRAAAPEAAALLKQLTPRELQVFALLPSGGTNAHIGEQLGIAAGTVKVHIERILHKLDLRDRTQAAVRAADCGLGS
ncbi:helix-turn-helix transcriptional regulator [Duganella sp. sic0402]|uniref:response regulator transcription factor n=1 Tax=Duganella sp. sic0402 TaxID=2854786 RepID=UPI001C44B6D8|nr:helix-turn-helix transcriptional regulator [Duganella sp. sic0402]MBV7534331.1 helix-turn-helix transcriptional regulator [Duganella sp. sic0402]